MHRPRDSPCTYRHFNRCPGRLTAVGWLIRFPFSLAVLKMDPLGQRLLDRLLGVFFVRFFFFFTVTVTFPLNMTSKLQACQSRGYFLHLMVETCAERQEGTIAEALMSAFSINEEFQQALTGAR